MTVRSPPRGESNDRLLGVIQTQTDVAGAVVALVMRRTAWLTGAGALAGLAGAFACLKILSSLVRLQAVSLMDGVAFAAGLAMVIGAAAIAAYAPARRAARVDPALTLRADS